MASLANQQNEVAPRSPLAALASSLDFVPTQDSHLQPDAQKGNRKENKNAQKKQNDEHPELRLQDVAK